MSFQERRLQAPQIAEEKSPRLAGGTFPNLEA